MELKGAAHCFFVIVDAFSTVLYQAIKTMK